MASSQEIKIGFAGRVERIEPLGARALKVPPVHFDPNFALAVRVESVDQQKTPIQAGREAVFAIHSPAKLFAEDAEKVVGRRFDFTITWHTGPPERFSGLSVVRDAGTPDDESARRTEETLALVRRPREFAERAGEQAEPPTPAVAWGEAVNGLQAGIVFKGVAARPSGDAVLELHVRNTGKKPVRLLRLSVAEDYWAPPPFDVR